MGINPIHNNLTLNPKNRRGYCRLKLMFLSKTQIRAKRCREKKCWHFEKYDRDKRYQVRTHWTQFR